LAGSEADEGFFRFWPVIDRAAGEVWGESCSPSWRSLLETAIRKAHEEKLKEAREKDEKE